MIQQYICLILIVKMKMASFGTAVLLKFNIKSVYYNTYPLTLYFQVQFMKVYCNPNTNDTIKCALKIAIISKEEDRFGGQKREDIPRNTKGISKNKVPTKSRNL